ncbi:unnamed protein product [Rotaria socialis]|uniref:Uncharacterized protein n=3 Tax=Rotaria socialis TaxID=392032 RepID=A0A818XQL0_9BILA|nr:unnamed protein product [Rotaria socialis]
MSTKTISCFLLILCSVLLVQVKSQICHGVAQYAKCSPNTGCGCLHIPGAINVGICSYEFLVECSELVKCDHNNLCYEPDHRCFHHPRCQSSPVCYPVPTYNRQLCPPITMTNITTTAPVPTTTTTRAQQLGNIPANATWAQNAVTIAGGNGYGGATNQLSVPHGLFVDDDQTVVIAEWANHRIVQWKKSDTTNGQVVAGGKDAGNGLHQLDRPTDVLIDKETNSLTICDYGNRRVVRWSRRSGTTQGEILIDNIQCYGLAMDEQRYLYVSDWEKDEVRRYQLGEKNSTLVAGGNGKGDELNQLNWPKYLFVDRQQTVYVSDYNNHRVMKWNKGANEGIVIIGGQGQGNALTQLYYPNDLVIDTLGTLYVADSWNHRVMRCTQGDKQKQGAVIVGGNGQGAGANQFNFPFGLSFDRHGNLYVADRDNNRVQRFSIE